MTRGSAGRLQIAIMGAGSFGTSLAAVVVKNGHDAILVGRNPDTVREINDEHHNERYLPRVVLPPLLRATVDPSLVAAADFVLIVVPSHEMRSTCRQLRPWVSPKQVVVHATKGLEIGTRMRMSEVILEEFPELSPRLLAVLSGPSHAEEVSREMPTTIAVSSASRTTAEAVQDAFMNVALRVYTNPDVVGTELGGALKNIIALGCGISDGLAYGDNARAALMTRGLVEIARLGTRMGAAYSTFSGLTGIGDLIVTCTSQHSRNWRTGFMLGQGVELDAALAHIGMAVEGIRTTRVALELADEMGVQMPIARAIGDVLLGDKSPQMAVSDLMSRLPRHEMEELVLETASWEYS